jgi:hypothetical protein
MELIVLSIGLDLGVVSPTPFAMLVIMALLTTFATTPLLDFVYRAARVRRLSPSRPCRRLGARARMPRARRPRFGLQ